MSTSSIRLASVCACLLALPAMTGCSSGPRAVRGSDEPGLDHGAMSTGLDRKDLQQMVQDNMAALEASAIVAEWKKQTDRTKRPGLAVLPMENQTSEHIEGALSALVSDVETRLVNFGAVRVVSLESQQKLIEEMKRQSGGAFNQENVAKLGQQVGAQYVISTKVSTTDERIEDQRRVQYFMFMQVLDVATGEILFQNKVNTTKAIIRD
jgi:PBP1b-binding outer membrane lipoprotein LpoB